MDEDTEDVLCDAVDAVLSAESASERLAALMWMEDVCGIIRTLTEAEWDAEHSEIDGDS